MTQTPDARPFRAHIEQHLGQEGIRPRESWTDDDAIILYALHSAITAARRKGYSEADLHRTLRVLSAM
ncbi:MAG TPA: hypothetical protein VF221_14395 [Chloroflexota bacterium]